ncbi:hypothetical protein E8E12_000026, partial [Didymella heteroderae]
MSQMAMEPSVNSLAPHKLVITVELGSRGATKPDRVSPYKEVPPAKQDRSMMQLQESVNDISDVLKNLVGEFTSWRQSVESRLPL